MARSSYQPVPHDHEAFLEKARQKEGFQETYDALEEEYGVIRELIAARSRGNTLKLSAARSRFGWFRSKLNTLPY